MERVKSEVNRLNQDKEFIEFLSAEDEERLYTNTLKENSFNEGVEQRNNELVKNMLNEGLTLEFISKITGLSVNEIKRLSKE